MPGLLGARRGLAIWPRSAPAARDATATTSSSPARRSGPASLATRTGASCVVRTDASGRPSIAGITFLLVDMDSVRESTIRPLRRDDRSQAWFNEVFFDRRAPCPGRQRRRRDRSRLGDRDDDPRARARFFERPARATHGRRGAADRDRREAHALGTARRPPTDDPVDSPEARRTTLARTITILKMTAYRNVPMLSKQTGSPRVRRDRSLKVFWSRAGPARSRRRRSRSSARSGHDSRRRPERAVDDGYWAYELAVVPGSQHLRGHVRGAAQHHREPGVGASAGPLRRITLDPWGGRASAGPAPSMTFRATLRSRAAQ